MGNPLARGKGLPAIKRVKTLIGTPCIYSRLGSPRKASVPSFAREGVLLGSSILFQESSSSS